MSEILDPTVLDLDANTIDDPFEYFDPFIEQIKNINIRDFDFDIFKKYVEELSVDEFEQLWKNKIFPVLQVIDENYLIVDIEEFEKSAPDVKQVMLVEYIEFLMSVLPYKVVFAKYIKKPFKSLTDLENWLSDKNIANDLALLLQEDVTIINNMFSLIKTTIASSKKADEYNQRAEKLKSYIEYENNFRDYFIGIVEDTDNEMLKNLILKYYESEFL